MNALAPAEYADTLTPTEAAAEQTVAADIERAFAGWLRQGHDRGTVIPLLFLAAAAVAQQHGVQRATVEALVDLIWGDDCGTLRA